MRTPQKFGMGTSNRPDMVGRFISTVPGPGNYKSTLFDKTSNPNFGMGTSKRGELGKSVNVPGPGTYATK